MDDYSLALEGYDSYDLELEDNWPRDEQLPWQHEPEPRQITVQPRKEPAPVKRIEVSPKKKGPDGVPKLKLGLEDVEEEEPLRLQQTGNTTGGIFICIIYLSTLSFVSNKQNSPYHIAYAGVIFLFCITQVPKPINSTIMML